ncbi:MAG: phosphoribosylglycinamide formyltransferase [Pseudomonadota bacterium]
MQKKLNISVLASGEGTTLQAIIDAVKSNALSANFAIVLSNNLDSGALRRANNGAIKTAHLSGTTHADPAQLDQAICAALTDSKTDVVILAGYMKKIGPLTLAAFRNRIINTHPALLPKFGGHGMYGNRVHQAVLAAGEQETGVSVHLVDEEYDTGAVIAQATVAVLAGDTVERLSARVQATEKVLFVDTLQKIATGAIVLPQ